MGIELISRTWMYSAPLISLSSPLCEYINISIQYFFFFSHDMNLNLLIIFCVFEKKNRLGDGVKPFEAVVTIPRLVIKAKYTSSGVLIIIPASGGGEFNAVFGKIHDFN